MSDMSSVRIDECAANLDVLWSQVRQILTAPYSEFDEKFHAGQKAKRNELFVCADEMKAVLNELLSIPIYMGNATKAAEYNKLEVILVRNIARVCRIDADTGIHLRKMFFQHSRSIQATMQIMWKSYWNRVGYWLDDGERGHN